MAGNLEFIIKKNSETYFIWPAACPHEGGPLIDGKFCEAKVACPWHGLEFSAAQVSVESPFAFKQGFEYELNNNQIYIKQSTVADLSLKNIACSEALQA